MSFATKLCHVVYADGSAHDVMKHPATDKGKISLPGEPACAVCVAVCAVVWQVVSREDTQAAQHSVWSDAFHRLLRQPADTVLALLDARAAAALFLPPPAPALQVCWLSSASTASQLCSQQTAARCHLRTTCCRLVGGGGYAFPDTLLEVFSYSGHFHRWAVLSTLLSI
jgi:hypothetical protein